MKTAYEPVIGYFIIFFKTVTQVLMSVDKLK